MKRKAVMSRAGAMSGRRTLGKEGVKSKGDETVGEGGNEMHPRC